MDNSSGQHVVVSKPLGVFCLRCHAGTSSGLPYFDKEDLAPAIRESETLKVLCQDVVKAYHEPNPGDEVCTDDVRSTTATTEELRCVYNAFERSAFMSQHSGCTPEELFSEPVGGLCHPRTKRPLPDLYLAEAENHFQIVCSTSLQASRSENRMPHSCYALQGVHTYEYYSTRIPSKVAGVTPPPPRAQMQARMKELAAKRSASSRSVVKKEAPSTGAVSRAPEAPSGIPPALSPVATFFSASPPVGKADSAASKTIRFRQGPPTCAKSAPAAPTKDQGAAGQPRPQYTSQSGVKIRLNRGPQGSQGTSDSVKQETPHQLAGTKRAAPAEPQAAPVAKRFAVKAEAAPRAAAPASQRPATAVLPRKSASSEVVDLARVKVASDLSPGSGSKKSGYNKFENAWMAVDLYKILQGVNLEGDITLARRMAGFAKRESPEEWLPKLEERLEHAAGCKEILLVRMMLRNKFEVVVQVVVQVQKAFPDGQLPLSAWCDFVMAFRASQHLKPWKTSNDIPGLLAALALRGKGTVEYDPENPSWFCDHITDKDRLEGVIVGRFIFFIETYVLAAQIKAGEPNRRAVIKIIAEYLLPFVAGLPEQAQSSKPVEVFKERLLGTLWTLGLLPFQCGCNSKHVAALTIDKTNPVSDVMVNTKYARKLLDMAFMHAAGEKLAWPAITECLKKLNDAQDLGDARAAMADIISQYPTWQTQCRDTALPERVHADVLGWCHKRIQRKQRQEGSDALLPLSANDEEVVFIFRSLQSVASLKWTEVKLDELRMALSSVAASLKKSDDEANIVGACSKINKEATAEDLVECAKNLLGTLPKKGSKVLITGDHRRVVVLALRTFGHQCLGVWPAKSPEFYQVAICVLERVEIDVSSPLAEGSTMEDLQTNLGEMQLNFHVFRRMQGFENLLSEIVALGNLTEQLVEQKSSQQMLQKLQLYLEFFKTDPGFQKVALESAVNDTFASKVNKSESLVSQFKTLYFGNGLKNAQARVDKVQATAGGAGTTGGDWTESATSTSWPEFATQTETTLRAVDKIQLLLDIQACDSVAGLQILKRGCIQDIVQIVLGVRPAF